MSNPRRGRTCTRSGPSPDRTLLGLGLEISGFPGLVEGCLLGAVDAEVDEPACSGVGLDPLVLVPGGAAGPKNRSTESSPAVSGKSNSELSTALACPVWI